MGMEDAWLQPKLVHELSQKKEERKTSLRLRTMVGLELKILGKINTYGRENLLEIPEGKKVLLVATHISDIDMSVVIGALGEDFDMKISTKSMNLDRSKDAFGSIGPLLAGRNNFLPVDYGRRPDGKRMAEINPENFKTMADVLQNGQEILIAAHNPSSGKLPRGGIGASYIYQLGHGDFVILPVAVNVKSEKPYRAGNEVSLFKERPVTDVFIGKPITLNAIENIDDYAKLIEKKSRGEELTPEEIVESKSLHKQLLSNSDTIMESLAYMLPEEKRGYYQHKEALQDQAEEKIPEKDLEVTT